MNTGILAATWLCMVLGQAPNTPETLYFNSRNHRVPVNIPPNLRADLREMLLYASPDQGRNWQQVDRITPEKDGFTFYAPKDGTYWLRVAQVNKQGVQEPSDKVLMLGPPNMIMVIDTLKPIIQTIKAKRDGEEVYVNWDVQEDNLDRTGMKLEFQIKDALSGAWATVPGVTNALQGQVKFRPGTNQPLVIRLSVRDLAGNQSYALDELTGTVAVAGFTNPGGNATPNSANPPSLPFEIALPIQPSEPVKAAAPMFPPHEPVKVVAPLFPPSEPVKVAAPPLPPPPGVDPPSHKVLTPGPIAPPALAREPLVTEKVIADSRNPPQPEPSHTAQTGALNPLPGAIRPSGLDPLHPAKPAVPMRKPIPEIKYLNRHQVMLQYELKRVGPSGVGGIQIWLTRDDGDTWKPYAEVTDIGNDATVGRQERNFDFRDQDDMPFPDGVYGLILVVKNRAGLGRTPKAGDVPEIRVEIDTKTPIAQLFKPMPDPQRPDQVLLKWFADDKNLAATPINLEYAVNRDGPWLPIQFDLKNEGRYTNKIISGDYSWKVPANFPVQVYLRLRVRDKAGNESVAVSGQPEYLDLTEPEGALIGVQTK